MRGIVGFLILGYDGEILLLEVVQMTKVCKFCKEEKDLDLFEKDKRAPDGHSCRCLVCAKEIKRVSALKHRDERLERQRKYREEHPEEYKAMKHEEYIKHKTRYNEYNKKYYEENKEEYLQMCYDYRNKRYKDDPSKRIPDYLRCRVRNALQGTSFSTDTERMIGCTRSELISYFERLFTEGMTWSNYTFAGWGTDHTKPCSLFDLTDDVQRCICFNYRNMRPMWHTENMKKGSLWTEQDELSWRQNIWPEIQKDLLARGIIDSSYEGC
jgi:hypothetical protein